MTESVKEEREQWGNEDENIMSGYYTWHFKAFIVLFEITIFTNIQCFSFNNHKTLGFCLSENSRRSSFGIKRFVKFISAKPYFQEFVALIRIWCTKKWGMTRVNVCSVMKPQ